MAKQSAAALPLFSMAPTISQAWRVAPLIKAMQEQQAQIDHLRAGLAVVFCIALVPGFLLWRNRAK
jgi:hypothetical protein